jgi:hypothetical protein
MIELNGTASEEDSGKGPGDFSKHLQERQPDVVLLSDTSETQRGLFIVNYHFYRNDFLQHKKAPLPPLLFLLLLHAPLLGVILHALLLYLQLQSLGQLPPLPCLCESYGGLIAFW